MRPCPNKLIGDGEAVDESGAGGPQIKSADVFHPHLFLNLHRTAGEEIVGGDGAEDYEINIVWIKSGRIESDGGSIDGEVGGGGRFVHVVPLLDAAPIGNPFIGGVHQLFEVSVGHHPLGHSMAHAGNLRSFHFTPA